MKKILKALLILTISLTSCNDDNGINESSDDTNRILFEAKVGINYQIFTMNVDGSNETQITDFVDGDNYIYTGDADWSPDGNKIVFISGKDNDNGSSIYIMNSDGSNANRINHNSRNEQAPVFSENGQKILFEAKVGMNYQIFTMNIDGSNETQITDFVDGDNYIYTGDADWSPDGNKIAFISGKDDDNGSSIYIMNSDGSNVNRINHNSRNEQALCWK